MVGMMTGTFLETPVEYLKGVGPSRAEILKKELQIFTFGELLSLFPFRYIDRSKIFRIAEITDDVAYVQVKGRITDVEMPGSYGAKRLVATLADESGELELIWFQGIKWIVDKIKPGTVFTVFGKPSWFNGRLTIAHPDLELPEDHSSTVSDTFRPLYSSTEKLKARGLDSKGISKLIRTLIESERFYIPENLSPEILKSLNLMNRQEAFINVHFPANHEILQKAQARVQISPTIMNGACFCFQHSPMFGHAASSQTVCRFFCRINWRTSAASAEVGALTRIHSGFRGDGLSGLWAFSGWRTI